MNGQLWQECFCGTEPVCASCENTARLRGAYVGDESFAITGPRGVLPKTDNSIPVVSDPRRGINTPVDPVITLISHG